MSEIVRAKEIIHAMKRYYVMKTGELHKGLKFFIERAEKVKAEATVLENLYCDMCKEIDMLNLVLVAYKKDKDEEWKMCLCDVSKICAISSTSMEAWAKTLPLTDLETLYKIALIAMQFHKLPSADKIEFLKSEKFVKIK